MKRTNLSTAVLGLAICALLIGSASQNVKAEEKKSPDSSGAIFATSAADGGRLYISRSPLLGGNVAVTIKIDGQPAGELMQGQTYDKYITPGRHVLKASPDQGDAWETTLNVERGKTYSYLASYETTKLVLTPAPPPQ